MWILNVEDTTSELGTWSLHIIPYDFTIFHQANVKYLAQDALSRIGTEKYNIDAEAPIVAVAKSVQKIPAKPLIAQQKRVKTKETTQNLHS